MQHQQFFVLKTTSVELPPLGTESVKVLMCPMDPGKYTGKITFCIEYGEVKHCYISAEAIGCSILCEPSLEPDLDLGYLLTNEPFSLDIKLTNMGKRKYKLVWSNKSKLKNFVKDTDTELK